MSNASHLAPVFVNDARVRLQGDPKPRIAQIVQATGRVPYDLHVMRLSGQGDSSGRPVQLQDTIDRTQEGGPVYLKCVAQGDPLWVRGPGGGGLAQPESDAPAQPEPQGIGTLNGLTGEATAATPAIDARELADEVNQSHRENRRAESADQIAQDDGTQRPSSS